MGVDGEDAVAVSCQVSTSISPSPPPVIGANAQESAGRAALGRRSAAAPCCNGRLKFRISEPCCCRIRLPSFLLHATRDQQPSACLLSRAGPLRRYDVQPSSRHRDDRDSVLERRTNRRSTPEHGSRLHQPAHQSSINHALNRKLRNSSLSTQTIHEESMNRPPELNPNPLLCA
ncbi:hypothetical protein M409DRAFT_51181 [Zasmidium cellare ATCC 36951]|uniref:Uncharacterized protein n=1 Tax=Zasmidium cellare ATCC 36951 TaxID=1080233 RepID=A0A6A6CUZ8_ZASCE|nr:uncharacterized protein M409DRAFT_51181 [Zasmidium cellare ATCC 36951]KAF2170941.1 hypothetical protein M409DRAFT_51181 [Zasmidium cellare ATCC 36951]